MSDETFYGFDDDRKQSRHERKRRAARDRSKFKKSDQKATALPPPDDASLIHGRVLAITSEGVTVEIAPGHTRICTLRGSLKQANTRHKNLVAVGDFVRIDGSAIAYVEPRRSLLSRADALSRRKQQIIAANIDQVLITASVVTPPLKPFLIDRYIIAARKGMMTPIVVINKVDLLHNSEECALFEEASAAYAQASITTLPVSATTGAGLDALKEVMQGKASVFSGQSGTGKSSLINTIVGTTLATNTTVAQTKKGAHTTTVAQLLPLDFGGWCIDTPGIKSFGIWDLTSSEIESYYEEISTIGQRCRFSDCSHTHEEACAVKEALQKGAVSALRYDSYLALRQSVEAEHRRR